jgi:hypothetical protein
MKRRDFFLIFILLSSCKAQVIKYYKYTLIQKETNLSINADLDLFGAKFISYKNCLIEFDRRLNFDNAINTQNKQNSTYYDTASILVMLPNKNTYFQIDSFKKNAVILKSDDINLKNIGISLRIDSNSRQEQPIFSILSMRDTTLTKMNYKVYDSTIESNNSSNSKISFYYIKYRGLKTPFNINEQIRNIGGDYCFAGFSYLNDKNTALAINLIVDLKELNKSELDICESIYQKVIKYVDSNK